MQVDQLIPNFAPGDAMGQAAVGFQLLLRRLGHFGQLYAGEVAPGYEALVKPASALRPSRDGLVLYHHGIASEWAGRLAHFEGRRGVVFHNVTPARFYAGTRLEEALSSGRSQLTALADTVELSIGVSELNVLELKEAGHRNVQLVPLFVEAQRFDADQVDPVMARAFSDGTPSVLSVSRVVKHKRIEDLLSLHAELLRICPRAQLVIVGGFSPGDPAFQALSKRAEQLGRVRFLGRVSHAELVAAYRQADVYVSMSEHEGFGVPLVEAMAADVPVLAFGAASVPWTLGGTGLVFDTKHFAALAELVKELSDNPVLRAELVDGQQRRLAELSPANSQRALGRALSTIEGRRPTSNDLEESRFIPSGVEGRGERPISTKLEESRFNPSRVEGRRPTSDDLEESRFIPSGVEGRGQRPVSADDPKTVRREARPADGTAAPHASPRTKPRVAIIVQRFGAEITGGAESHARQVALKLAATCDVTVLTTCATDHLTWANDLPDGREEDGPLNVLRFRTEAPRQMRSFNRLSDSLFGRAQDRVAEEHWLAEQGPRTPQLLEYLATHREDHDAFIFFTYLYTPTAWGVPLVADRALVVPTAHDEPPFRFDAFAEVFETPRALLCNTPEEQQLIEQRFPNAARSRVVGVGIEPPRRLDPRSFAQEYGLRGPYLLYVGRLESGKGLDALLDHHRQLVKLFHDAPILVLAGGGDFKASGERVRVLGRISDEDKWNGLAGALAAVAPSKYESLSLLALEAFSVGTPLLANAESSVLEGHLARSGAGLSFRSAESYVGAVRRVGQLRAALSAKALKYARQFRWPAVMGAYREEIRKILALSGGDRRKDRPS